MFQFCWNESSGSMVEKVISLRSYMSEDIFILLFTLDEWFRCAHILGSLRTLKAFLHFLSLPNLLLRCLMPFWFLKLWWESPPTTYIDIIFTILGIQLIPSICKLVSFTSGKFHCIISLLISSSPFYILFFWSSCHLDNGPTDLIV